MSDPVTNVEIEDVLSSIRRLVSSDAPSAKAEAGQSDVAKDAPAVDSRFVLTPALRVSQEPAPEAYHPEVKEENDVEIEAAAEFVAPSPLLLTPHSQPQEPLVHDDMSDTDRESLETKIAELEAAVSSSADDEWEPDGSEVTHTSHLKEVFDAHDKSEAIAQEPTEEDAFAAIAAAQEADQPIFPQEEVAEPVVANPTPEFRHIPIDDPSTDHGDELRDDAGMPIPDDLDETIAAYIAGGSAMKDEDMRQMIVDVVREELRGELGDRITRNVRKMVRREVLAALQTHRID